MRGLLTALAIVGGALLLRRGSADDGPIDKPHEPAYSVMESDGDWYVVEDEAIVCGPYVSQLQAEDSLTRWKSTRHCT